MKSTKTVIRLLAAAALTFGLAESTTGRANSNVDKVEGELWAADCLVNADEAICTRQALQKGEPGGVLNNGKFTVLLVDGRVLAGSCDLAKGSARIRATGK